jgi:hypothetical protein
MTDEPTDDVDQGASELLEGPVFGGPLDGGQMTSRRPAGVLLVDRPARQCWLYDWRDGAFHSRGPEPAPLVDDPGAPDNRERAAEEGEWDVQAAPWVGAEPDLIDPTDDPEALTADAGDVDVPGELGDEVTGPIDESEV